MSAFLARVVLTATVVLPLVSACDQSTRAGSIQHPTRENLPADAQMAEVVRMEGSPSSTLHLAASRLSGAREVLSVGALEGDRYGVFGAVGDLYSDAQGQFTVLDSRFNEVRLYDARGRIIEAFGRPGRGPLEFVAPERLDSDRAGRFVVADRNAEIKVFERDSGEFRHRTTIHLEFTPEDFCMLDGRIFVQGVGQRRAGTIHVYSMGGEHVRSFGEPYRSENPLVRSQLSDGRIGCSEDAQTVVTMFEHLPVLYGYGPDGNLRWMSRLGDFRSISIEEGSEPDGQPYVLMGASGDAYDQVELIEAIPGGYVVVQVAHHTPESVKDRRDYAQLRTYLLSARDGSGAYVGDQLPRIHRVSAGRIFAAVDDPFPQVKIFELAPPPEAS